VIDFDCHAHIYERVRAVTGTRYVPTTPAPLTGWLAHHDRHGIKGGVIVQVSFLGTDNSELCAALARLDRSRFAGVAVVALDADEDTLEPLVRAGVRGLRWNLIRGQDIPDLKSPVTQGFFAKMRRYGLHLEIHLEGARLAPVLPALTDQGVGVVIDHFGLPTEPDARRDPMIAATRALSDPSPLYFKFSAQYRIPFDVHDHAEALLSNLGPGHIVWGSDWPHTQHETMTGFADVYALSKGWRLSCDNTAVADLYGLAPTPAFPA